jgi:HlyD family secretion protein
MKNIKAKDKAIEWRKFALFGYSLIFFTFGVMGLWAAIAKVDKAVVASGWVSVETNKKTIQHLEGGIVKEILVKEGQHVKKGQPLIKLENTQAKANSDILYNQLMSGLALEARLIAERDDKSKIEWPVEFKDYQQSTYLTKLVEDEERQFLERRETLNGQISIIESKRSQLKTEIEGIDIEKKSAEKQVVLSNQEMKSVRDLHKKQLVPTTRLLALERELARLEGIIGKTITETAKAQNAVSEMGIQIEQTKQKFKEDVATNLLDVRTKLSDFRQKNIVATDVLKRVELQAPRSGTVQNLKAFTIGQVIRPGEPILDIVPDDEALIIQAQFQPQDIDVVHDGQKAEIKFPAFHSRTLPTMEGVIETLSHDRLVDEASRQPYYLGTIVISKADIPGEYEVRLRPGMPAEIIVAAGERTVLNYLVSPLSSAIRKTFIEQ